MKKQGKRRSGLLVLVLALALSMLRTTSAQATSAAYRNGPDIYGEAYCVMDADTGEIICAKNAMGLYHPASITKIMTALVTIEQVKDLNETLTYSENAVNGISVHSSTCQPKAMVGEKMTVWDTLNGMMLVSGNECAMALAEHVGGTVENFMDMVNKRVKELGATNTHFTNPHGIDNVEHYTNPYDMALLFRAALQNDTFRKLVSSVTYTIPVTNLCSTPRVLTMGHQIVAGNIEFDGVYAGKTGRTAWAGRTLLTAAEHNGRNFVVALMKSGEDYFYTDTEILLEYAYAVADGQEPWGWQECNETYIHCQFQCKSARSGESVWNRARISVAGTGSDLHRYLCGLVSRCDRQSDILCGCFFCASEECAGNSLGDGAGKRDGDDCRDAGKHRGRE